MDKEELIKFMVKVTYELIATAELKSPPSHLFHSKYQKTLKVKGL